MDSQQAPSNPSLPPLSSTMKTYHMAYTTSRFNVRLHLNSAEGPCIYYLESSIITTKPQLQLRFGDSKSSPMVAFAKIPIMGRHFLMGTGDYKHDSEDKLVWEDLNRVKNFMRRSDYEFGTSIGFPGRKTYVWKRDMTKTYETAYICVDDEGKEVGRMLSGGALNWKKAGELKVGKDLVKELEELIIVSAFAIWAAEGLIGWSLVRAYDKGEREEVAAH